MSGDQLAGVIGIGLCLTLVGSALAARRLPAGQMVRMAVIWIGLFAAVAIAIRLLGLA